MNNSCNVAVGQCQQFHHTCHYTIFIKVVLLRDFYFSICLAENSNELAGLLGVLNQLHAGFTAYQDGCYHPREDNQISQGQYGNLVRNVRLVQVRIVTIYICNHRKSSAILFFIHFYLPKNNIEVQRYKINMNYRR